MKAYSLSEPFKISDPETERGTVASQPFFLQLLIAFAIIILVTLLFFIKTEHMSGVNKILLSYTIFITGFQFFRLFAATVNKTTVEHLIKTGKRTYLGTYYPRVSIVVPCMNEEAAIKNTLLKCFEAHYPKDRLEVIAINDGSTDATLREMRKVKHLHKELTIINFKKNKGKREGMAAGFRIATGEIIVQLDSDSYIEPDSFYELILPFINPEVGAVCAHADVANPDTNIITKMQSGYYYVAFKILKAAESAFGSVFCCSGCSSAYRKNLVLPIMDEWLQENFMGVKVKHGDDRSLSGWVLKQGYKAIYTDKVHAYTIAPDTAKQLMRQQIRWKKSWVSNSYFTFGYIFKTDWLVGVFYYTPLIVISFLTPLVAFWNIYFLLFVYGTLPLVYILGALVVALIYVLVSLLIGGKGNRTYVAYFIAWQVLASFMFSYILYYSFFTFRDQRWGTR